jgi:alpha-1,3-rhamnosyltransferase
MRVVAQLALSVSEASNGLLYCLHSVMETNPSKKKVFVLIPSYNHHRYIERCIESVANQNVLPTRLLVIDDGSTDGSVEIIERCLNGLKFDCEFIARENRGLSKTLNEGFSKSDGDYFAYLGSDDLWYPDFLEQRLMVLESRPDAVLAFGHSDVLDADNQITECSTSFEDDWGFFIDGNPMEMLSYGNSPVSSSVLYRSHSISGLSWNEHSRLEDFEMYLRLARKGSFAFDPAVRSAWRRHGRNTSNDSVMMMNEIVSSIDRVEKEGLLSPEWAETFRRRARFRFARVFLQNGQKYLAVKFGFANLSGRRDARSFAAYFLRLLIPFSLITLIKHIRRGR